MFQTTRFQTMRSIALPGSTAARTPKLAIPLALVSLLLGGVGCGLGGPDDKADDEGLNQTQGSISGGNLVSTNAAPFDSVVKLPGCTGTKIGPRRFLTAAHCAGMVNAVRGTDARVTIDNSIAGNAPTSVAVDRFFIHPSYATADFQGFDAAVLDVLQDTPSINALPIDTVATPAGTSLTLAGYGCDDRTPANGGMKQFAQLSTLSLAEMVALNPNSGASPAVMDANYYVYNGGPVTGAFVQVCPGDSGGPALRNVGGWRIAGIDVYRFNDSSGNLRFSASTKTASIASWLAAPTLMSTHGTIINVLTGECLSGGGAVASGSQVKQEPCNYISSGGTQSWDVIPYNLNGIVRSAIRNRMSGYCLDGGLQPGTTTITMVPCKPQDRQRWSLTPGSQPGEVTQQLTQQRLGAFGQGGVDLYDQESGNRQRWLVAP